MFQSTHPRRVRLQRLPGLQRLDCFNPRTHAGCDNIAEWTQKVHATFQSTHPRRCDHRSAARCHCGRGVSIHAPRRVRRGFPLLYAIEGVSIHAPAGCDDQPQLFRAQSAVSIHAPTQGATFPRVVPESLAQFQSTHPRRVRRLLAAGSACIGFQSTHPRRVRPARRVGRIAANRVSIHAPTQGATPLRPVFRVGDVVSIHAPTQGATLRR